MTTTFRPRFDDGLIARYGGEGPRYTSYPTAVQFSESFQARDLVNALDESNRLPIPPDLSLYAHVPFCASPCFYCGCNRVITRSTTIGQEFLAHLEQELDLLVDHVDPDRQVQQVHLGGGTPTFLTTGQIGQLMRLLKTRFPFAETPEIGLEIDPRSVEPSGIRELRELGFDRLSVGVQDLDPAVQKAVNRVHDAEQVEAIIGAAHRVGFRSISVDLIYGLPLQRPESFARTVEAIVAMRPGRVSLFNYAHMPHLFKAQKQIRAAELPAPATKLALFRNTVNRLLDAGYEFIGMDHFALPDDDLAVARRDGTMVRNFQGYSTHGGLDLLALGPSAISQVGDAFAQNRRGLIDWQAALEEGSLPVLRGLLRSAEDRLRAEIISDIMCFGEIEYRKFERDHEIVFDAHFGPELGRCEALADDGLIEWTAGGFRATPSGLLFLRTVAMAFDAYLHEGRTNGSRFSRVV